MTDDELWAWRVAVYRKTVDENPWVVKKPAKNAKQRTFLLFSDVREMFYGGAGGGGKSISILQAAAQFVDVPGYRALLLRENFRDLEAAWILESKEWWTNTGAVWNQTNTRWTFPSGAMIEFGYMDRDSAVYQYDGPEFQFIGIDEVTQHSEWRYKFLFARLRKKSEGPLSQVPLRVRCASNPGGKGHQWVKKRFVDARTREKDVLFIPATQQDNIAYLNIEDYRESLAKLDPITRRQRELGDWDAVEGGRFRREWFAPRYKQISPNTFRLYSPGKPDRVVCPLKDIYQTCDPAASDKTSADYTVLCTWGVTDRHELLLLDVVRVQMDLPDIPKLILAHYRKWNASYCAIEAVGGNSSVLQYCRREPMVVKGLNPRGKDKLVRATPAMVFAESGRFYLPQASSWLEDFEAELFLFTGDDSKDAFDDTVDAVSYGVWCVDMHGPKNSSFPPYVHQNG